MGNRLSKIYTRTGDQGTTGLGNGERIDKDSSRIEVIGDVDELNCAIGLVLVQDLRDSIRQCLSQVQHKLFDLGGELSVPGYQALQEQNVHHLEANLDDFNQELPPLKEFILPGGGLAAAACHLARAICRRAERHMIALSREHEINRQGQIYLNRLSDLLFVIGRILARDEGGSDVLWYNEQRRQPAK